MMMSWPINQLWMSRKGWGFPVVFDIVNRVEQLVTRQIDFVGGDDMFLCVRTDSDDGQLNSGFSSVLWLLNVKSVFINCWPDERHQLTLKLFIMWTAKSYSQQAVDLFRSGVDELSPRCGNDEKHSGKHDVPDQVAQQRHFPSLINHNETRFYVRRYSIHDKLTQQLGCEWLEAAGERGGKKWWKTR